MDLNFVVRKLERVVENLEKDAKEIVVGNRNPRRLELGPDSLGRVG
jgi:hypothetical protein